MLNRIAKFAVDLVAAATILVVTGAAVTGASFAAYVLLEELCKNPLLPFEFVGALIVLRLMFDGISWAFRRFQP